jgi:hypothetical protein
LKEIQERAAVGQLRIQKLAVATGKELKGLAFAGYLVRERRLVATGKELKVNHRLSDPGRLIASVATGKELKAASLSLSYCALHPCSSNWERIESFTAADGSTQLPVWVATGKELKAQFFDADGGAYVCVATGKELKELPVTHVP